MEECVLFVYSCPCLKTASYVLLINWTIIIVSRIWDSNQPTLKLVLYCLH